MKSKELVLKEFNEQEKPRIIKVKMRQGFPSKSPNLAFIPEELSCLPTIGLIESSEQAFGEAFLRAAQILYQQLQQIQLNIEAIRDFTREPFNLATLGLFSKMCRHYYSYVLLEIHQDRVGSQFLIEHLCEAAITLTYLLEESDESLLSEYISASVHHARYLLMNVEEQLQNSPHHPDLLILRDKLKTFIADQQEHAVERSLTDNSEAYLWGPNEADTTAKRGAIIGLNFLTNPARHIALKVKPSCWLDLQLNYLNSLAKSSRTKAQPRIKFADLRDAAHLCLHATQAFLEELVNHQNVNSLNIKRQQQILSVLYEWFHKAQYVYQLEVAQSTKCSTCKPTDEDALGIASD